MKPQEQADGKTKQGTARIGWLVVGAGVAVLSVVLFVIAQESDSDSHGMSDAYETLFGIDPTNAADADANYDADSLNNLSEYGLSTDPFVADTDGDGWDDDADSNALSRAAIRWGEPKFTAGDEHTYVGPNWCAAYRIGGSVSIPSLGRSGTLTSETVSEDVRGNRGVQRTIVDRANKTVYHVSYSPDRTNEEVSVTVNGLSVSNLTRFGAWQVNSYDGLERQTSTVSRAGSARTIGAITHFNDKGQVDWSEDLASNRTALVYDPDTGRQVAVSNALGQVTRSEFDVEGRLLGTWGATYPVFYGYDEQGRMTNMFTLRDPAVEALVTNHASFVANIASFDRTTWLYDEATGLLTNKVYADGKGTKYSYASDGKLSTRTWARGVTTTYRYNESGAITNIDYSDSTPDVTFGYDRLGRRTNAVAAGVAAYGFEFDPVTSAMTNEVLSLAALPAARSLARSYDSLLRPAGFTLDSGQSVAYAYDCTGRLGAVAWAVGGNASTAQYAYVEQSGMIAGYDIEGAGGTFRTRKAFESSRDLVASVANLFISGSSTSVVSSFDYLNDALGRRVRRDDAGTGLSAAKTNLFGYNLRSELASAEMDTNSFGYVYDPIGNRTSATNNSEALTYLSNELNQYTNVADGVTNAPTYDDDGNMLTYGGWTFGWDGENRLISASNGTTVLTFVFDHQSRRIAKIAGSATNVFLYDGWAMIEEARCDVGEAATNSYVYGPDLSGTFQGAGTIGGILLADFAGTNVLFAFDANGNVTDLVATNGTLAAHYEFDPYGNVIASSGDLASANPYRFSTKYTDDETGLVYYGHRSYSPELGRWVSRDPIGEDGGMNLVVFVGNQPMHRFDLFGLVPYVARRGDVLADVVMYNDSVKELAELIGLDVAVYTMWLSPAYTGQTMPTVPTAKIPCDRFKIPNTIVAWRREWDNAGSSDVTYLRRLKFKVEEAQPTLPILVENELAVLLTQKAANKTLHGLYHRGHGASNRANTVLAKLGSSPGVIMLDATVTLSYKMAFVYLQGCHVEGLKTHLLSGTTGSIWYWTDWRSPFYDADDKIRPGDQGTPPR